MKITKLGICFKKRVRDDGLKIDDQLTWVWPWKRHEKIVWHSQKFNRFFVNKKKYLDCAKNYIKLTLRVYEKRKKLLTLGPEARYVDTDGAIE